MSRRLSRLAAVLALVVLLGSGVAWAAPSPEPHHDHDSHSHGQGMEVPSHDDDPNDLDTHLPIQVYYNLEYVNQPWRQEQNGKAYREMIRQGTALVLLQVGVLGWLWRRRQR